MKTIGLVPALLIWTIPLVIGVIGLVALLRISRSAGRMSSALEQIAAAVRGPAVTFRASHAGGPRVGAEASPVRVSSRSLQTAVADSLVK